MYNIVQHEVEACIQRCDTVVAAMAEVAFAKLVNSIRCSVLNTTLWWVQTCTRGMMLGP